MTFIAEKIGGMWTLRRIGMIVMFVALLTIAPWILTNLWENLDANEVMIIQHPINGELVCFTDPGLKWQGFGKVTKYPRRGLYAFDYKALDEKGEPTPKDTSKKLRFNDGGHANLYGSSQWEIPLDCPSMVTIQKKFNSAEGVENAAVSRMLDAAVYLAGPLMSSTESSGERRAELVQYINDQAENGVYVTQVREKEITDPITGVKKEVAITEIMRDKDGNPRRQQGSILGEFHIRLLPLSIKELAYDKIVENQIKQRQEATTQVQIAQANAKRAEQEKLTTEAQGAANAAAAKWKQETTKAQVVTEAQQNLEKATLAAREAEQYKRQQILIGEGDAQRKQLVMAADGALDQKIEAYKIVNQYYANAIAVAQPGAWTPSVVMAGRSGAGGSAVSLLELFSAKAARDLGIDMSVGGRAATAKTK